MLNNFLVCRERFRIRYVLGLKPKEQFTASMEYGNMWHICEENFARDGLAVAEGELQQYVKSLMQKFPADAEEVEKYYRICKLQFPIYIKYWSKQKDVKARTPLLQEYAFSLPYALPNGEVVLLRGKFDSVDMIGKGKNAGIYLQENKCKGDVDDAKIGKQLSSDLQTMLYIVALGELRSQPDERFAADEWDAPIRGVRYNVIKRPLSGGRHTISQHKPTKSNPSGESKEAFYSRLAGLIEGEPEFFFHRWTVDLHPGDVAAFTHRVLDNLLMQVCDWWEAIQEASDPFSSPLHFQFPYGVYNPLTERWGGDVYDRFIADGDRVGLEKATTVFPELEQ
jgi:hypothetical protein